MTSELMAPAESFLALLWKRFRKHRLAVISLKFIVGLILFCSPLSYYVFSLWTGFEYDKLFGYRLLLDDETVLYGDFSKNENQYVFTPVRYGNEWKILKSELVQPESSDPEKQTQWIKKNGDILKGTLLSHRSDYYLIKVKSVVYARKRVIEISKSKYLEPSFPSWEGNFFGTDKIGFDVFIRIIYGGQISLSVGIISSVLASILGVLIGSLAGFYGKGIDAALMRFTDAMLAIPVLPFMIVLSAVDMKKVPLLGSIVQYWEISEKWISIGKINLVIIFFSWMVVARLVRGSILSLKETQFIEAARALGLSNARIIIHHLIPNCMAPVIVATTLAIGSNIVYESVLSYLGLGIQPPTPSWGNMLTDAKDYMKDAPHLFLIPRTFISL
ncbi:MAG: ABC transporter permease, partial [Planctomycetota bacterium]